ncbi:hypothetical protein P3X46_015011 [Hevea brasiliensis]|uniref:NPR1/NIM1-like C-terminal domain-containing protein n=1 Tax=Hevea brasiliensis TaxID=3981 RepID=A0ABQ9LUN7_HEVBR|nr:NRR repressor homolog 3-like [Hevea brasiliensis]KAJ9171682.1 hypothetical protein P3X46_015011 [Hevea brasiliensis]
METPIKKRKLSQGDHHDDDEDNEEVKIEKFFALITNIREARDGLINGSVALKQDMDSNKKKRKLEEENNNMQVAVWKPSFQLEDFLEESHAKNPRATVVVTSQKNEVPEKEDAKEELDLRLSL